MSDELTELDKRVAHAMGWTLHEVDPLPPSWHKADTMICFYHDWYPTSSRRDWSFVEQWMVENFNDNQKTVYILMINRLLMTKIVFDIATAPLPVRCKAFLAAVETGASEEE